MLEKLMQTIFTRVAALLSERWSGEITIRVAMSRGGIRDARIFFATDEKWEVLTGNSKV